MQHVDLCWRGKPKVACAALYPRHGEATDTHETTEYRERMASKTCAPYYEKRPFARPYQ